MPRSTPRSAKRAKRARQMPAPRKRQSAAATQRELERTRAVMQVVLDNMDDGVALFDRDFRLVFGNPGYRVAHQYTDDYPVPGTPGYDMIGRLIARGEYGEVSDVDAKIKEIATRMWTANGRRYVRRRMSGRDIEYNFKVLDDGSLLGFLRDVTELGKREEALAAAKEAAEAARAEAERTREILQTIVDNMSDGVALFDPEFRWMFGNRRHRELHQYTPDFAQPGTSGYELIRRNVLRGEYGPVDDVEAKVQEIAARTRTPGGIRYERRTAAGKYIEYNFSYLNDGSLLGVYRDITQLKEREQALAAAKEAAEALRADAETTREIMRSVLDNMNDGVTLYDKDLRWLFSNPGMRSCCAIRPNCCGPTCRLRDRPLQIERGEYGQVENVMA